MSGSHLPVLLSAPRYDVEEVGLAVVGLDQFVTRKREIDLGAVLHTNRPRAIDRRQCFVGVLNNYIADVRIRHSTVYAVTIKLALLRGL